MHTVTLRSDDEFYEVLSDISKRLNLTKSEFIRRSVMDYKKKLDIALLKKQIKNASMAVRTESLDICNEFEDAINDGLESV
ncbi:MAG: Unknown protein [uncultured Campylobacterales bacterium]|uniref:Ribbon-helix-helix protein CopG domain-containing protein n=1 Tax=uncultured Campylobacterales bacterium TaxID=352960 RepID=A0A6S6SCU1_9BACT|nr:MAG: Unknown protein [uncultured Campylobacterales bacterium]